MPELLPSNSNHPSILAFQNSSHIPFPSSEWWLPCVIKYSTSQQRFIKKEVHEFLKLFCKSLWELTMKANTSAGVQLPSYPRIQPDTGICGNLPLWCVRNPPLSGVWEALPPLWVQQPHPHSESCSGTQCSSVRRRWFEGYLMGCVCQCSRAVGSMGSKAASWHSPDTKQAVWSVLVLQCWWLLLFLERNWWGT